MKLATALIGISSVNLLKTFIEVSSKPMPDHAIMWQLLLHLTFVVSALPLAVTDRISNQTAMHRTPPKIIVQVRTERSRPPRPGLRPSLDSESETTDFQRSKNPCRDFGAQGSPRSSIVLALVVVLSSIPDRHRYEPSDLRDAGEAEASPY